MRALWDMRLNFGKRERERKCYTLGIIAIRKRRIKRKHDAIAVLLAYKAHRTGKGETVEAMTDAAKAKRAEYMREWRARNPEKVQEANRRYWQRKADKEQGEEWQQQSEKTSA